MFMSCRPSEVNHASALCSLLLALTVQCLEMTTKRKLIGRLVPCRCFRGEEEVISVLDYSHCSLQQVPKEIFSFERTLEELYLDANQIEELPKVALTHVLTLCCLNCPFLPLTTFTVCLFWSPLLLSSASLSQNSNTVCAIVSHSQFTTESCSVHADLLAALE